jgi:pantetheine-phosphate adenylyltransferase
MAFTDPIQDGGLPKRPSHEMPGGTRLFCTATGQRRPVLLLHGLDPLCLEPGSGRSALAERALRGRAFNDSSLKGGQRMHRAVCPGSFDPVTNGHLDIISRAAALYDEVVVAVGTNTAKHGLFTVDERVEMLGEVTGQFGNVKIDRFHGLLVDFCVANGITAVVKGLRAVSDFENEMQMAQMNYRMAKVETLFMTTTPLYSFLSSSLIKEIARYGADVSELVPGPVLSRLRSRLSSKLSLPEERDQAVSAAGSTNPRRIRLTRCWRRQRGRPARRTVKLLNNQVSNNPGGQRWTPEDVHGRCKAGQTRRDCWYDTSRVGFGTKRPAC